MEKGEEDGEGFVFCISSFIDDDDEEKKEECRLHAPASLQKGRRRMAYVVLCCHDDDYNYDFCCDDNEGKE